MSDDNTNNKPQRRIMINTAIDPNLLASPAKIPEAELSSETKTLIEWANTFLTAHNQMNLIKEKFKYDCMMSHNGGTFNLTRSFLSDVKFCIDEGESGGIFIDHYGAPIMILRLKEFYVEAYSRFKESLNAYAAGYRRMQRGMKSLKAERALELA